MFHVWYKNKLNTCVRLQKPAYSYIHAQMQTKLAGTRCSLLCSNADLSHINTHTTQCIWTVLLQLRLATTYPEWCLKLTLSGQLNCALHTLLDSLGEPSITLSILQMEPEFSSHFKKPWFHELNVTPLNPNTVEGFQCQTEPQI